MVELGRRLAYYTHQAHPEVGGRDQIAIFQKQRSVSIEQQKFPQPPKTLVNFSLMVDSHFSYSSIVWRKACLSFLSDARGLECSGNWMVTTLSEMILRNPFY